VQELFNALAIGWGWSHGSGGSQWAEKEQFSMGPALITASLPGAGDPGTGHRKPAC
jgi:hypothetical protein